MNGQSSKPEENTCTTWAQWPCAAETGALMEADPWKHFSCPAHTLQPAAPSLQGHVCLFAAIFGGVITSSSVWYFLLHCCLSATGYRAALSGIWDFGDLQANWFCHCLSAAWAAGMLCVVLREVRAAKEVTVTDPAYMLYTQCTVHASEESHRHVIWMTDWDFSAKNFSKNLYK